MRFTRQTLLHSRSARLFCFKIFFCSLISRVELSRWRMCFIIFHPSWSIPPSLYFCVFLLYSLWRSALRLHLWKAESFLSLFSPLRLEFINTLARCWLLLFRDLFFLLFFPLRFQFHSYTCLTTPRQSGDIFSRVSSFHFCVYSMFYYGVHFTFTLYSWVVITVKTLLFRRNNSCFLLIPSVVVTHEFHQKYYKTISKSCTIT